MQLHPLRVVLTFVALALAGCTSRAAPADEELGKLGLPLAVESDGVTYRILGEIVIRRKRDGSVAATIDAGATSPSTETVKLLPGAYTVEVSPGYSCSVEPADDSFTGCTYTGSSPERFVITPGRTTTVALNFTFHFDDDVGVVLRTGNANIVLMSAKDKACGEGCPSGTICASVDGAASACAEECATSEDCPVGEACFTLEAESMSVCASVVTELWTKQFGTSESDGAYSVSTDADGNVVVAGYTSGTLSGQTSAGGVDAFLQKLSPDGDVLWTRQFGSDQSDLLETVNVDGEGSVLVGGRTEGAMPGEVNLGASDAFVQKFDADGNSVWSTQFGSYSQDSVTSISTDGEGNSFVVGQTLEALPGQLNLGATDAFVVKLNGSGDVVWVLQFGTEGSDYAYSISADGLGNLFVAGSTDGALTGQTSSGVIDAFVQKLDATYGFLIWTRQFGTGGTDKALSVSAVGDGGVVVTGAIDQQQDGGLAYRSDAFVQKFDADGTVTWMRQFGTSDWDSASSIATDIGGNVIVGGFVGQIPRSLTLGTPFARKFDSDGADLWTVEIGAANGETSGVRADDDGNVLLAGWSDGLEGQLYYGDRDAFVKKLGP